MTIAEADRGEARSSLPPFPDKSLPLLKTLLLRHASRFDTIFHFEPHGTAFASTRLLVSRDPFGFSSLERATASL